MEGKIISTAPLGENSHREPRLLVVTEEMEVIVEKDIPPSPAKTISMDN